jgi:hypothetical protein
LNTVSQLQSSGWDRSERRLQLNDVLHAYLGADTVEGLKFPLALESTALNMFISASDAGFEQPDDSAVIKIFSGITIPKKGE